MRPPLASKVELPGQRGVEDHRRLDPHQPVLRAPEAHRVDPRAMGHLAGPTAQHDQRIGKARPVHVDPEPVALGHPRHRAELVQRVDRPLLGRLRHAHRPALGPVHAARSLRRNRARQRPWRQLRLRRRHQRQLRTPGKELGRVAFILLHMRHGRTEDRLPGPRHRGQQKRIRRRPRRHQKDRSLGRGKDVANARPHLFHDRIRTIGLGVPLVRAHQRGHHLGMHRPGIVGCEIHVPGSSMIRSSQSSSSTSVSGTVIPRTDTPARCTLSGSPEISGCQS